MREATSPSSYRNTQIPAVEVGPDVPRPGENTVVWILWLTYGAFYFCRTNISAAVPGIEQPVAEGGLGMPSTQIGLILALSKLAYGLGQFLNGQLAERLSPRVMLAVGMFGSATLNVLFGFGTGFYFLLFVWATNGFCQSLGWTPVMRVAVNWVPIARRGRAIGIIGTGYQITAGLTFLVAGQSAAMLGWRGALYVPAALLASAGLVMLLFLREAPQDAAPAEGTPLLPPTERSRVSLGEALYCTLYNPALWLLGVTLALLNACRYGYFDWGLKHMVDVGKMPVNKAALQYFVIAGGATAGSYLAGWATDRFFGGRRAPVICLLMLILSGLSLVYGEIAAASPVATMLLLVVIGFCIMGPQVLLVGTAPADLAQRGTSAAAAGFVNFMGYMGAATGDIVTGYFADPQNGGWQVAIQIWAGWALAGAAVTALLWNTTARTVKLLPGIVPKTGALATFIIAGVASAMGYQSTMAQMTAWAAALCVIGTLVNRNLALPAMVIAAVGLILVFRNYLGHGQTMTWNEAGIMLAYALSMVFTLMILVEQVEKDKSCA